MYLAEVPIPEKRLYYYFSDKVQCNHIFGDHCEMHPAKDIDLEQSSHNDYYPSSPGLKKHTLPMGLHLLIDYPTDQFQPQGLP